MDHLVDSKRSVAKLGFRFLARRFREVLLYYGFEYSEVQLSILAVIWGIWTLNQDSVSLLYTGTIWKTSVLHYLMPPVCSLVFIGTGLFMLWAVLMDHRRFRRTGSLIGAMVWLFLGLTMMEDFLRSPTVPFYFVFALSNGWVYLKGP